jgi:hypothetical protein
MPQRSGYRTKGPEGGIATPLQQPFHAVAERHDVAADQVILGKGFIGGITQPWRHYAAPGTMGGDPFEPKAAVLIDLSTCRWRVASEAIALLMSLAGFDSKHDNRPGSVFASHLRG